MPKFQAHMEAVVQEKARLREALEKMDVVRQVKASDTNFFMFQVDNAEQVYKTMADAGVVVRYRGNCLHCADCLRVTVGTKAENDQFLELLASTCAKLKAGTRGGA